MSVLKHAGERTDAAKPRVAVIGGGIFGTTCALILGERFSVTLFERHSDLLMEATRANQYRHHAGYHYPRSPKTIQEIQASAGDFEDFYGEIIYGKAPSYYCVAKEGSLVSPSEFLHICEQFGLQHGIVDPPAEMLNRDSVSLCVKTSEKLYDYAALKSMVKEKFSDSRSIALCYGTEVVGTVIRQNGEKVLTLRQGAKRLEEAFDFVVNTTYAGYNNFCTWLSFPRRDIEFRLKEIVVIELPIKEHCAVTIMDGPFATLVPIPGSVNLYTLGDVPLSIHETMHGIDSITVDDKRWKAHRSRWKEIIERCTYWFPILTSASYQESMFVVLPVEPNAHHTDARPTDVISHGQGCFSVFSGKIITAVSAAKRIREGITSYAT